MTEAELKAGTSYLYQSTNVIVRKVTESTVFFNLESATDDKPLYVRKNTFLSRAEVIPEVLEQGFIAGRQCGKTQLVAEAMESAVKTFGATTGRVSAAQTPEQLIESMNYRSVDAPWNHEKDVVFFQHRGLKCLILRHPRMGHLCGYVRVPRSKLMKRLRGYENKLVPPLKPPPGISAAIFKGSSFSKARHKNAYDHKDARSLDVHGGLTFSGKPWHYKARRGLWLGFDTAHCDDLVPAMRGFGVRQGAVYADMLYVEGHCRKLADQIIDLINKEK